MRWTWKGSYDETQPERPPIENALREAVRAGVTRVATLLGVSHEVAARKVETAARVRPGTVGRLESGQTPRRGHVARRVHKGIEKIEKRAHAKAEKRKGPK